MNKKFMSELKKALKAEEKAKAAAAAAAAAGAASSSFNPNPSTAAPKAKSRARAKSQAPAEPKAKAKAKARARSVDNDDDDVEISGISVNKSEDLKYWREQSANELRAQLKLRDREKYNREWAFKFKADLIKIIKELIKNKQW